LSFVELQFVPRTAFVPTSSCSPPYAVRGFAVTSLTFSMSLQEFSGFLHKSRLFLHDSTRFGILPMFLQLRFSMSTNPPLGLALFDTLNLAGIGRAPAVDFRVLFLPFACVHHAHTIFLKPGGTKFRRRFFLSGSVRTFTPLGQQKNIYLFSPPRICCFFFSRFLSFLTRPRGKNTPFARIFFSTFFCRAALMRLSSVPICSRKSVLFFFALSCQYRRTCQSLLPRLVFLFLSFLLHPNFSHLSR